MEAFILGLLHSEHLQPMKEYLLSAEPMSPVFPQRPQGSLGTRVAVKDLKLCPLIPPMVAVMLRDWRADFL